MADHTTNDLGKLNELLRDVRFTMFTTRIDGRLRSRPMTMIQAESDGSLWFFGARGSEVVDDVTADPVVGLAFSDNGASTYVSVSGTAELRDDAAKRHELWNPAMKAWFDGADDPAIALIEVRIDAAEYWDGPSSKLVRLVGIVAAAVTGKEYDAGEQGEIELGAVSGR